MNILFTNVALVSFTASLLGGIIPIRRKQASHAPWMHYIDLFCDSMFMAIALGHILPEIHHHSSHIGFIIAALTILSTAYTIHYVGQKDSPRFRQFFIYIFFLHCFIEGIAFPILSDHDVQTTLSITVITHKIIEPFVFFNLLSRQKWSQKELFLLLIFFSSLTPLGIYVGAYLTKLPESILTFINAVTCGTFIGISANCYFNTGCKSHSHHPSRLISLFFLILALILVSTLGHHHCH